MTRPDSFARVAQRSAVATVEITVAATVAHAVAGGHLPAVGFLLAFSLVVFGCCLVTIGRVLSVAVTVPFVLVVQFGLHGALDSGPVAHHGSLHGAVAPDGLLGLSPVMFWAHLVTAVVTAIFLLLQGRIIAAVVASWRPLPQPFSLLSGSAPLAVTSRVSVVLPAVLLRAAPRRGPPVPTFATL